MVKKLDKKQVELRKELLKTRLKMLGYSEEEKNGKLTGRLTRLPDDDKSLRFLGRLGKRLHYFEEKEKNGSVDDLEIMLEEENLLIENQSELMRRVRSEYPDYCMNMQEKVSEEDWELYSRVTKQVGDLFKDINSDVLKAAYKDYGSLNGLELQDVISEVIDSTSFSKACAIEDAFVKEEGERFIEIAAERDYENEAVRNTQPALALAELVREVDATGREKDKYIESYNKYKKFRENHAETIEIRGNGSGGRKEHE